MDTGVAEQVFLSLYDEQADTLFRHCYFRVHDRELAKDLAHEAFTRTWDSLRKGKTIENQKAFLFRTAHNLIIDHYRRKKEVSLEELSLQGFEPSGDEHERIVEGAAGREALAAVAHLEDEYRQIIVLRYVNDLSIGEIAEVTGETENVISVRIHRALKKLKSFLEHGPL